MPLAAQSVQSIGDLFLIRVFEKQHSASCCNDKTDDGLGSSSVDIEHASPSVVSSWVRTTARILQEQWPRQQDGQRPAIHSKPYTTNSGHDKSEESNAPIDEDSNYDYYRKFLVHHEQSYPCYNLACSYILVQQKIYGSTKTTNIMGHGRLTECYESAGGNAAAITYVLINPAWRGKGYGKYLIRLLELEAKSKKRLGHQYHFLYLWCKTTIMPFYERNGYKHSRNRLSLQRPCLKVLTPTSVQSLEAIFQRRQKHVQTGLAAESSGNTRKKLETVTLLSSSSVLPGAKMDESIGQDRCQDHCPQLIKEEDVWLRKRLVDHVESIQISERDRMDELEHFATSVNTPNMTSKNWNPKIKYFCRWNPKVPWQMQIGPSCGLTAIRMVKDFYYDAITEGHERKLQQEETSNGSSLLADAQERGYTQDGEIFDASHLGELMGDQLQATGGSEYFRNKVSRGNKVHSYGTKERSTDSIAVRMREISSVTAKDVDSTLRNGGVWIIPYDSNTRTKLPSRMQGKNAHWGIVVGIIYATRNYDDVDRPLLTFLENDNEFPVAMHQLDETTKECNTYWIVQHSLSSKWAIAPMKEWVDSNQQLVCVNEDKFKVSKVGSLNLQNRIIQILPELSHQTTVY